MMRLALASLFVSLLALLSSGCTQETSFLISFEPSPSPYDSSDGSELSFALGFEEGTFANDTLVQLQLLISTDTYSEVYGLDREITFPAGTTSFQINWAGINNVGNAVYPGLYVATCVVQVLEQLSGGQTVSVGGPNATIESKFLVK